ncbi:MAG: DUF2934 domain-containing protein [Cyanobacteria bacterium SZAS-4]|nr:DUF2934 domain-containing protein [Cyanobacteria bacterium SZAS-4]
MSNVTKKSKVIKIAKKESQPKLEKAPIQRTSIADLAYQFWIESGRQGDDLTHWLRAEQQIIKEQK